MDDTPQRLRGEKLGNGIVKREIVKFLLQSDGGCSSENKIRSHLFDRYHVSDRTTIRNQHLGYLKTKGIIDVKREPGKDNYWFVVNNPSIADYVFAEFKGNTLIEIYRADFFQNNIHSWHRQKKRVQGWPDDLRTKIDKMVTPKSWEQYYLGTKMRSLEADAMKVSPAVFLGDFESAEGNVISCLLMYSGKSGNKGESPFDNIAEIGLGSMIADLLVDFDRYKSLQGDILTFMKRIDFLQLFETLFPEEVIGMVFRAMSILYHRVDGTSFSEFKQSFEFEVPGPLIVPPEPIDWNKNQSLIPTNLENRDH